MSHPPPTVTHTGLRPTKYTPQQQLATATATTSARHACRGERLLAASSQARIGTGVPHGGRRGNRAGCWGKRGSPRWPATPTKRQKGHRTCGNRTYVDAVLLVENVSPRALLLLLLLLLRGWLRRQPRHKLVVGGVVKFATSS